MVQQIHMPKGIFLIIVLFLMLGGARLELAVHTTPLLFPFEVNDPVPFKYEGKSVFSSLLFVLPGFVFLMVVYGLYTKKGWSHPLTLIVSGFYVIYGLIIGLLFVYRAVLFLFVEELRDQMNAFTGVLIAVSTTYNITIAILMLFVIRYLRRQEIKQWFAGSLEDA